MKRLIHVLSAFLWLALPAAGAAAEQHVYVFGGVDAQHDPMLIADQDATAAQNVLTDEGDLRTIYGNTLYDTVAASSITFIGEYINSGGQRIAFIKSGTTLYSNDLSTGSFITVATYSAERDLDMVSAFGKAYFADGTAYPFYSTGSSTAAAAAGMESCKYVELYATRLVCVNTSTETSKVYLSKYNDPDTWTTGSGVDDAVYKFFYKGDGEDINCVFATNEGLFIGKASRTGMLKGSDNESFYWTDVARDVGCVDDRSVQMVDGELVWLSKDGFYAYDFAGAPRPISVKIKPYTDKIRQSNSADSYWLVDTKADWEKGTYTGWDTTTSSGSIISKVYNSGVLTESSCTLHPMYDNAGLEAGTMEGWGQFSSNTDLYSSTKAASMPSGFYQSSAPAGQYAFYSGGGSYNGNVFTILKYPELTLISSTTIELNPIADSPPGAGRKPRCADHEFTGVPTDTQVLFVISEDTYDTGIATSSAFTSDGTVGYRLCDYQIDSGGVLNYRMYDLLDNTNITISSTKTVYDSGLESPTYIISAKGQNSEVAWYSSASSTSFTSSGTIALGGTTAPVNYRYYTFGVNYSSNVAVSSFTSITVSVLSTAAYYSEVKYLSDLADWGLFTVSKTTAGANPLFYVRAGTYPYTQTAASPTWTLQTEDSEIVADTENYYQFKIDPNIPTSTCSVTIAYANSAYSQGYPAPRVASGVKDHRYLVCVSSNSADYNDLCGIWQKNKEWTFTNQTYGALGSYNHYLLGGSTNTASRLWKVLDPSADDFAGTTIDAWWETKDFTLGAVNNHKTLDRFWISADGGGVASFGVGWQADRSGVWNSTSTALSGTSFVMKELDGMFLDTAPVARQFRFKFSGAEADKYFRLKGYSIYYTVNPLIKD